MPNLLVSLMRMAVPLVAGWILAQAARLGLDLDSQAVSDAVTAALAFVYYAAFRLLERAGEKARGTALQTVAGALLGWARPPEYPRRPDTKLGALARSRR